MFTGNFITTPLAPRPRCHGFLVASPAHGRKMSTSTFASKLVKLLVPVGQFAFQTSRVLLVLVSPAFPVIVHCGSALLVFRLGEAASLHRQFFQMPTCYCCISMPNSARTNKYKPQRKVLFGTGTQQAHGILSPFFCFWTEKAPGERTGEGDLHSDTSLVH
jgi:hypothetical protein